MYENRAALSNLDLFVNYLLSKTDERDPANAMYISSLDMEYTTVILINGNFTKFINVTSGVPQGFHLCLPFFKYLLKRP